MGLGVITVDSSYQTKDYHFYYVDSLTQIFPSYNHSIIELKDGSYVFGGTLSDRFAFLDIGIFVVKTDSALNVIWQKQIRNDSMPTVMDMIATDDGGVLVLYNYTDTELGAARSSSKLIKIGPNGEVTTIYEFKGPLIQPKVSLYPNPATKQITLECKQAGLRINSYIIYDAQGKALQSKGPDKNTIKIDIEYLPKGAYIIQGQTSDGAIFSRKFIKN